MRVLGLHINGAQSSAAMLQDGRIVAGIAEERLNRDKQSSEFPLRAGRWCLESVGLSSAEDLDALAVSWNPTQSYGLGGRLVGWRGIVDRLAHAPENLASF